MQPSEGTSGEVPAGGLASPSTLRVMPAASPLGEDEMRRLRTAAQHLHRPTRRSAAELVHHLTGVQAQVLSAAGLALRARTDGLTAEQVERARLQDRSLVLTWAMRGTLHLICAEDYGWLVPLVVEPRLGNAHRRLKAEGVSVDQSATALRLIERMLEREGALTRDEIADRLRGQGVRTEGQAIAHLVWLAAAEGVICHGADRGGQRCFVLVRDWLGQPEPRDRDAALAELAVRYLAAHGPAEPEDLVAWSGIRPADARRSWRRIEDRLVPLQTALGVRWALRSPPDPAPAGLVRLLPAFDEYLLGWRDRRLVVPPEHRTAINRGGGWLHPVLLHDGRAAGTWSAERRSQAFRLQIRPFSPLSAAVRRLAEREARALASFLGLEVEPALA